MALAGCAKQESGQRPRAAVVLKSSAGEFLAYEHNVTLRLDAERIPARVQALQDACMRKQHGDCTVLEVSQRGGDHPRGMLTVRIVPAGVEPLIAAASEGADPGDRSTRAEDLAESVRDNALTRSRLQKELSGLQAFQQRRDLSVADMIALSQQVSRLEAQLEAADQEAAQHQRRIQTQKVSLHFETPGGENGRGEIRQAVADFFATLASGTAWTIRAVAFLIPVLVVLLILVVAWRRLRRRRA
ncbi:hypothetical protein ASD72_14460 [Pseudoxanthomonas sp. Root630]|nr:hypothetical protein ASD72_14460 [Pseudoxanthomonas sp. Root630]